MLFHYNLIKMNHTNCISEDTVMLCTFYCCIQVNVTFIHKCKKNSMEYVDRRVKCITSTGVELHCIMSYDLHMVVRDYKQDGGRKKQEKNTCEI